MWGFGKAAGPAAPPASQPSFGNYPSPPTRSPPAPPPPTFPHSAPPGSPRFSLDNRRVEAVQRVLSPSSTFGSTKPAATPSYPLVGAHRPVDSSSRVANEQRYFFKNDVPISPRASATTSFVASHNSGSSITAKIVRFQDPKKTRLPPSNSTGQDIPRYSTQNSVRNSLDSHVNHGNHLVPPRIRSPSFVLENYYVDHDRPLGEGPRPSLSPPAQGLQPKMPRTYSDFLDSEDKSSVSPVVGFLDSRRSLISEATDVQAPKQTRSSPIPASNEIFLESDRFLQKDFSRPITRPQASFSTLHSQIPQRSMSSVNSTTIEAVPTKVSGFSIAKRTRSPPTSSTNKVFPGNSYSTQDDSEREIQAKAKRLARFKNELTEGFETIPDTVDKKIFISRSEQSMAETQKSAGDNYIGSGEDFTSHLNSSDLESLEMSSTIVGLCPDMCPESERMERERKGDLDQYERMDGDRNQTNKYLAVKKYNRTAEREGSLIRPMPILQKTTDYLLNLLDQPYGDGFLVLYNFLWDRMRAIRMDLRMQHIFNLKAITMLEQMIRLHIIAMHELCEYTKGEGFSEGFDAHLNIEQMNKTSVELFQMYDDHRKKGIDVPTEKEFRGYYALLKLDKHPGYKVEPTELSLDLAKMTPEIRQTPEVHFARDVARACRTGNFIAFFRLARKASYLQACLMHAHFAKVRTQALSSLHAGLQSNQGLPVADIAKWLAMEEEDVESLLEYHGFSIKEFEESYMVKEGPFLNSDKDYPTNYSKLVQLKRSGTIVNDVAEKPQMISVLAEATKEVQLPKINKHETKSIPSLVDRKRPIHEIKEQMPDFKVFPSPKVATPVQSVFGKLILNQDQYIHQEPGVQISPWGSFLARNSLEAQSPKLRSVEKPNHEALMVVSPKRKMPSGTESMLSDVESKPMQIVSRSVLQERPLSGKFNCTLEEVNSQIMVTNNSQDLQPPDIHMVNKSSDVMEDHEDEVARAKLKLIIRLWRRRSSKQRELREQRQIAASAALSLLSLGPPIQQARDQTSMQSKFDIDQIMKERYENHEKSWSRLNVSDVVADILGRRNPDAKCLCWKIVLCSPMTYQEGEKERQRSGVTHGAASQWLFSKLMPSGRDDYDDNNNPILSCPGLSIWRRWAPDQSGDDLICCFSVVKDVKFDNLRESISGASAVLFLVSESIPWNLQRIQLHHLLKSIPCGSALPLLILSGSHHREVSDLSSIIVHELGLHDIDKSQVGSFSIVFLVEDKQMEHFDGFFSDKNLREGLLWLASESPLQPDLHCLKPLELVLTHLNLSLDFLEKITEYEIGPNHCISAFNESLNWSMGEISTTAKANPVGWPCPEIFLLEDLSDENMLVKWYLPSTGWSSATTIKPLLCALRNCKLPSFPDTESLLDKGAYLSNEVETLVSQLEECLIRYLTESSGTMGLLLAKKEVHFMLQRSTQLELRDSGYYIIPKWITVFRRIFNWRLSALSNGPWSFVYVQSLGHQNPTSQVLEDLDVDEIVPSPHLSQPSLDEMINAGFGLDLTSCHLQPEACQTLAITVPTGNAVVDANLREDEKILGQNGYSSVTESSDHVTSELNTTSAEGAVARKATKEADKLSKLLEQCNMVQNSIDHKLYIYF